MYKDLLKGFFREFSKYPFIRTYHKGITFGEVEENIEVYSKQLSYLEGKRVGIISIPSPDIITLICTLMRLNSQIVLLSPFEPPAVIYNFLTGMQVSALFCEDDCLSKYRESPIPVMSAKNIQNTKVGDLKLSSSNNECQFIITTSGSSSTPKKVILTLNNLITNAHYSNKNLPFQMGDNWLLSLPLFHVSGLSILFRAIEGGGCIYIPSKIHWWDGDFPSKITHLSVVSTIMKRLLDKKDWFQGKRLKSILLGGGPIPEGIVRQCYDMCLPIYTTYGLTEMSSQVTTSCQNDSLSHLLTSGKPLIPDTVKIDEDGNISVRGPCRFQGYLLYDDKLEQPFDNEGWFATQDIGQWTEDGYLKISGRKDNIFICGGENIQPEEIENEIMSSGFVNKVIVVPMEDEEYGYIPVAFVEFSGSTKENELKNYLKEKISGIKIPKYFIPFPEELEEKGIKISRKTLKNWLCNQKIGN